jgi:hypothetical protein
MLTRCGQAVSNVSFVRPRNRVDIVTMPKSNYVARFHTTSGLTRVFGRGYATATEEILFPCPKSGVLGS